jgi:hypothetical protein
MIDWEQFIEDNRHWQALTWWRDYCLLYNDKKAWKEISGRDEI